MTTFLFLFHSTVGVVRMRKALQAAGMSFEVKDIPRQLRQRLRAVHSAGGDGRRSAKLDPAEADGGAVSAGRGSMALCGYLPAGGLIGYDKARRRKAVQQTMHEKDQG